MSWGTALEALPWTVLASLVLWYLRDRRKDKAAAEVAEKTVDADVAVKEVGADDARLVHLAKTWDTERAGLLRAIADRDGVVEWQRSELERRDGAIAHRDAIIAELRRQIDDMDTLAADLTRQLVAARHQIDELEQASPPPARRDLSDGSPTSR